MKKSGFTLIELLIVIAIIVLLAIFSVLNLSGFRVQQSLRVAASNFSTFLRDAQQKSISQEDGLQWGVRLAKPGSGRDYYYLFNGPSFTSAIVTVALPSGLEFDPASGPFPKDLIFAKATGLPISAATITIRLVNNPSSNAIITINAQGSIR